MFYSGDSRGNVLRFEWFRVQGVFGRMLHALASGLFGLMSVILPVFLALVAFSLIYETKRKSGNVRMVAGWSMILWCVCSILDAALASDAQGFDMALLQNAGGLLGYVLGCPLACGLSRRSPSLFSWSSFCSRCC